MTIIGNDAIDLIPFRKLKIYCNPNEAMLVENFCCEIPDNKKCPLRTTQVPKAEDRNLFAGELSDTLC